MSTPRKANGGLKRPVQETLQGHHEALQDLSNRDQHLYNLMQEGFARMDKRFDRLETMFTAVLKHAYVPPTPQYPSIEDLLKDLS
jgi:hypothetical protein